MMRGLKHRAMALPARLRNINVTQTEEKKHRTKFGISLLIFAFAFFTDLLL